MNNFKKDEEVFEEFYLKLIHINCAEFECVYCFEGQEGWPDCRRPETSLFNGHIKGYGTGECNCPYFKKNPKN